MIKVYMDAGYKNGLSTHNWYMKKNGKTIKSKTYKLNHLGGNVQAEMDTLEDVMKYIMEKGLRDVVIHTDCKTIVNYLSKESKYKSTNFLRHQMKHNNIIVKWVSRYNRNIAKADNTCRNLREKLAI